MKKLVRQTLSLLCAAALLLGCAVTVSAGGGRKIDVWDFTAQTEADTSLYENHITPAAWAASGAMADGTLSNGSVVAFGDLSMTHNANDRIYSAVESADWAGILGGNAQNKYGNVYDDGYEATGGWYCNGAGGESKRFIELANVQAGDKIVAYMGSASGDITFHFDCVGGQQAETVSVEGKAFGRFEFVAQESGVYKLWTDPAGKAMFHRVLRLPGVAVTGTVSLPDGFDAADWAVKFVDQTTRQETEAALTAERAFSVSLAPGRSYSAKLTGATGWGFTAQTKTLTLADADGISGKAGVTLVVEPKSTYTYSGKLTGLSAETDRTHLALTLLPAEGSEANPVELTLDKNNLSFSGVLDPSVEYTVSLEGANDYQVASPAVIASEGISYSENIVLEPKATYTVSGKFLGLEGGVSALSFENVEDGYIYPAAVTAEGYTVALRPGSYLAKATAEGYATATHVVVEDRAVEKDLLFVSTAQSAAQTWAGDLYVGCPDQANNYATVSQAVEAASRMGVDSEEERVTIHIAPGTYREQVIVDTPYLTLTSTDPGQEVLLTWYYGIGYKYYSAKDGYYDAQSAYDRFEKGVADRWGCAVRVKSGAKGFRAEHITFENSFNRYITDEEIADGAEPTGESVTLPRNYNTDVTSKAATERAAAVCVEAPQSEFYRCAFLSSQDTLYTGDDAYFKNCLIEGQTDYIFGSGNVVFDACELRWKGYSEGSTGGYITAARQEPDEKGYLFRSCAVTANPDLTVTPGCYGRPWGKDAAVTFQRAALERADLIAPEGWTSMSGNKPEDARFHEFAATALDGQSVDTAQRVAGTVTDKAAQVADYLDWTPHYFYEEASDILTFVSGPIITDNGDINLPKAGHTLTVGYSFGPDDENDVSTIRWYRVAPDGAETLVKSAAANASKTYKIQADDLGCKIRVEVTPCTIGQKTAAPKSYTLLESVKEGWNDPGAAPGDVAVGQGINIFLAGDSTVKDYSAAGMYNDGKNQDEGSWGEWLQSYLGGGVTVVNYAQGGRSTRNFINEGSLDKIAEKIGPGDYLFIQFGHNDSSNADQSHITERYAPLGTPDASGVYPSTPGVKQPTPAGMPASWGETCYTWDCGGTYKWYLQQYIDVACNAGATPVLLTPVARMYYEADGSIRPHHDESTAEVKTNAYCTAVRQLAAEQDVLLIDAFALTEQMFVDAYAATGGDRAGQQVMCVGESTHSNKLGGMIEAALVAGAIQDLPVDIARAVQAPAKVLGETPKGETAFTVSGAGAFTAYDMLQDYGQEAPYWTGYGQALFDAIGQKAQSLSSGGFTDVPLGHWAESAISAMAEDGVLQGVGGGRFDPAASVTRATVMTLLARMAGVDTSGGSTWDETGVAWAVENGVSDGADPAGPITREQMATMLCRCAKESGQTSAADLAGFSDAAGVSPWAADGVAWAVERGVLSGKPGGLLDPQGVLTRAECAVMLWRLGQ